MGKEGKAPKEAKLSKEERAAKRVADAADKKKAAEAESLGPSMRLPTLDEHSFGNLFLQSERLPGGRPAREWAEVGALSASLAGQRVWVRARLATSRKQGKTLCFLQLRQTMRTVQAVVTSEQGAAIVAFAGALPRESVIDVYGTVTKPAEKVGSCTQQDVELQVEKLFCTSRSVAELPLQLEDAARSEAELAKDPTLTRVNQDVRLNHRVLDLRTAANQGILRVQAGVCRLFREFLLSQGFTEIHTPKLVAKASEGGADVFEVEYFGGSAYLAQSPQLFKQMALMADLERVFEIGPVFRSENALTHRHMTEFTGLDMEMCFNEHYHEALDMLDRLFNAVFEGLNARYRDELEAVRQQHPFADLRYRYPCLRLEYKEAMGLLRKHGPAMLERMLAEAQAAGETEKVIARLRERVPLVAAQPDTEDIGTEDEKLLGRIIAEVHGQDFYIVDKFPMAVRAFYTMVDPADARFSNSYDIFIRGEEVMSGAQRIHDPDELVAAATAKGVDLRPLQAYVDAFKYGAYPHAGGGVGLERVVMLFLGLPNIRKTSMFPRDPKRLTP